MSVRVSALLPGDDPSDHEIDDEVGLFLDEFVGILSAGCPSVENRTPDNDELAKTDDRDIEKPGVKVIP